MRRQCALHSCDGMLHYAVVRLIKFSIVTAEADIGFVLCPWRIFVTGPRFDRLVEACVRCQVNFLRLH